MLRLGVPDYGSVTAQPPSRMRGREWQIHYSALSASVGSTDVARRDGT